LFLVFFYTLPPYTLPPLPAIARLAAGTFYETIVPLTFYEIIKIGRFRKRDQDKNLKRFAV